MNKKIITKKEAREKGLTRYFTGVACTRGHYSERYVSGPCIACHQKKMDSASKVPTNAQLRENFEYHEETGQMWRLRQCGGRTLIKSKNSAGYLVTHLNYKSYLVHDLIFLIKGMAKNGLQCDHIDGDKLNNRWSNLRLVTQRVNMKNRPIYKNNKSGAQGVRKIGSKWGVDIFQNGKTINLGYYDSFNEAVEVRKLAEVKNGFHENHGRASCG